MTEENSGIFHISTNNTSYVFSVLPGGYLEHIYYGKRLRSPSFSLSAIREKHLLLPKTSLSPSRLYPTLSLDNTLLEFSTKEKGDYKTPQFSIHGKNGEKTFNPHYTGYKVSSGILRFKNARLPQSLSGEEDAETLEISFLDEERKIRIILVYTSFKKEDVIARRAIIINDGDGEIELTTASSLTLDIREQGMEMTTFSGCYGNEKQERVKKISEGTYINESRKMFTGESDPAVILEGKRGAYFTTLLYSGSHRTTVTETPSGITHVVSGINSAGFSWHLKKGEYFETPEGLLIYSEKGKDEVLSLHRSFVQKNIRRGVWKDRVKPVMLGIKESLGYSLNESGILNTAKEACKLGFDGVVLDDGWFGARNNEMTSLGDWYANTKRFPSGLILLSSEIHSLGLMFGLWFSPEVMNEKSKLFEEHPDWIIGRENSDNATREGEHLLDLTREDVQEWIIKTLSHIIENSSIDYIKWDLNRYESDIYSQSVENLGSFSHLYILGLYKVLDTIRKKFPSLYVETSLSGSLRLDDGILSFSESVKMTSSTDCEKHLNVLKNVSRLYPLSILSEEVSSSPDPYTGEEYPLYSRYEANVFGLLNYSILLKNEERNEIKNEIEFYKAYRTLFQYGSLNIEEDSVSRLVLSLTNGDASEIVVLYFVRSASTNGESEKIFVKNANENYDYTFIPREKYKVKNDEDLECYEISGDALKWAGITLKENNPGNKKDEDTRSIKNRETRLFILKKEDVE